MKYKDWIKEWLENYVKGSLKQRTYTRYAEIVCGHIIPTLGEYNSLTEHKREMMNRVGRLISEL